MRILALLLLFLGASAGPAQAQADEVTTAIEAGGNALQAGDLDEAEAAFERALGLAHDHAGAWLGLGLTHERGGRALEALGAVRRAQQLAPAVPEIAVALGRILAGLGSAEEALQALGQARALAPEQPEAYLLAALVLRDSGEAPGAIGVLEEALEEGVSDPTLSGQLGLLLLAEGRVDEAGSLATQDLERWPDQTVLRLVAGLALANDPERRPQAVEHLRRALELGIADAGRVHLELAAVLTGLGRDREALASVEEAVRILPESAEAYYRLGEARRAAGDADGAAAALARYQALSGEAKTRAEAARAREIALNEAQTLAQDGHPQEALERLAALLERWPTDARALSLRAKIRFALGQAAKALTDIRQALQTAPESVEYHYLAGLFLLELGDLPNAERALLQALTLDPSNGETLHLLGGIAAKRGRPDEAAEFFQSALDRGSDSLSLRLGYAAALDSLGRTDERDEQIEAYRRLKGESD